MPTFEKKYIHPIKAWIKNEYDYQYNFNKYESIIFITWLINVSLLLYVLLF
jgi:hypothetical protein